MPEELTLELMLANCRVELARSRLGYESERMHAVESASAQAELQRLLAEARSQVQQLSTALEEAKAERERLRAQLEEGDENVIAARIANDLIAGCQIQLSQTDAVCECIMSHLKGWQQASPPACEGERVKCTCSIESFGDLCWKKRNPTCPLCNKPPAAPKPAAGWTDNELNEAIAKDPVWYAEKLVAANQRADEAERSLGEAKELLLWAKDNANTKISFCKAVDKFLAAKEEKRG